MPTGVKVFNWIGTMWEGSLTFEAPMKFALGFLDHLRVGGITGVMLASPTLDFQFSDSYFVVAHFHYVMGGTVIFAVFAAIYFWWPKVTGRMLSERLGAWHFWLLMIGFNMTFFVMHLLGRNGMPRRVADYEPFDDFELWNMIVVDRLRRPGGGDGAVPVAVVRSLRSAADRRRRPVAGQLARVGDRFAAARAQLLVAAADPLRAAGVRLPLVGVRPSPWRREITCRPSNTTTTSTSTTSGSTAEREGRDVALERAHGVLHRARDDLHPVSDDPVGSSILLIASGFGGLIAGWTWDWGRRHGDRPEDRLDADHRRRASGRSACIPTQSLRPFTLAVGATASGAGIPLGSWMSMGGLAIVMSQVFLLVRDLDTER